MWAIRVDAVDH
jgi:hypothetical protein